MPRGRSALSADQKAEKKAQADRNLAADALLRLPAEQSSRKELFEKLRDLESEAKAAAAEAGGQKKRMKSVYGMTPASIGIMKTLLKLSPGECTATIRQVQLFIKDHALDAQADLFNHAGEPGTATPDEGSAFDNTGAGERHAAERGDDPGRARKRKTGEAPPAAPSAAMPLEEAKAAFEKASQDAQEKKRGKSKGDEPSFAQELAAENAKAEEHIRERRAGRSDDAPPAPPPVTTTASGSYKILN